MSDQNPASAIGASLGLQEPELQPLSGGMVGEVYLAAWPGGKRAVVKVDRRPEPQLALEGMMLQYLADQSRLPVPRVLLSRPDILALEFLPGHSRFSPEAERHAAELLADLHGRAGPRYGFDCDTLIGLLPQPNPWSDSWPTFFAQQRLLFLGRRAVDQGAMPAALCGRLERLCARLEELLPASPLPSLLHGDIWTSNLLADGDRITGVLDPAIYYGHAEVELAYIALFHSLGEPFFQRYEELRPLEGAFYGRRIHIYQLYPLLSHVCHFGGSYVQSTAQKLDLLGF